MRSAVLLALGIGCGFSVHGNRGVDGGVPDALDAPMPTDAPTTDTPLAVDASQPDAFVPPPPATCGAPQAMPDDFYTGTDWSVKNDSVSGDSLTLDGYNSNAYVFAVPTVSLVSAAATVDVQTAVGSAGSMAFAAAWPDGSGYDVIGFVSAGSGLQVGSWPATGSSSSASVAFDGSAMAFWQISESAGTVSFATSPDGSAWSAPIYTVPTPPWAPYAHLALDAAGAAGYDVVYAALGGSDAGSAMPWCNADTFHGAPGSDSIATSWGNTITSNASCTFGGSGVAVSTNGSCYFATSSRYDLVDSAVVIHWGSDTEASANPAVALASAASTEYLYFSNSGTSLCDSAGGHCVSHTFSAAGLDAYWRIAEYSATHELELSISADGSAWVPVLLYSEPFVPSAIEIGVGPSQPGSAHILGVN